MTKRRSPLILSDVGVTIARKYNFYGMIDRNWPKIRDTLQKLRTNNPYDIQEFCLEKTFVEPNKFFSNNDFDTLKFIAYKTGEHLLALTRVLGVIIRDKYLTEIGVDIDSIDLFDPTNLNE